MHSMRATTNLHCSKSSHRHQRWRVAATPEQRHAKAAAKYNTGPQGLIYTRPDLANLLVLDLSDAVKAHSSRAAQDPQMYAHRLAVQNQQQLQDNEQLDWNEIV